MIKGNLIKNRNIWYVSYRINGKQHIQSTGIKVDLKKLKDNPQYRPKAARDKMAEIMQKINSDIEIGINPTEKNNTLFVDYIAEWLERHKIRITENTYIHYKQYFTKHIEPYFRAKKLKVKEVTARDIELYFTVKLKTLSPNSVLKHSTLMCSAMNDAYKNGVIKRNPVILAEKPKKVKSQHNCYSGEQMRLLLKQVQGDNDNMEMPIFLATNFALRKEEVLGMRWSNIDFEKKLLTVCRAVIRIQDDNGKWFDIESGTLKSQASYRKINMDDRQCAYLKAVKGKQEKMLRNTDEYIDCICVNEIGERLRSDYVSKKLLKLLKKYEMPKITFHELRHSCISYLANNPNITMKQIQIFAGHADFSVTANTYSHTNLQQMKITADLLSECLLA